RKRSQRLFRFREVCAAHSSQRTCLHGDLLRASECLWPAPRRARSHAGDRDDGLTQARPPQRRERPYDEALNRLSPRKTYIPPRSPLSIAALTAAAQTKPAFDVATLKPSSMGTGPRGRVDRPRPAEPHRSLSLHRAPRTTRTQTRRAPAEIIVIDRIETTPAD